jgi:2-polyprenyl-6-hydroxyphenyl methylase / 3-demethylubiquinone-9 3-methyltransferase
MTRAAAPVGNADQAEIDKFDAQAHDFWNPHGKFRPLHLLNPLRTQFVRERAAIGGARVLDVGCGGGLLAESLARAGGEVTAIDLAPAMIEVARQHAAQQSLAIDYRVLAAEALLGERARFAVVICMEMLEHLPDPEAMLATLAALAAPGAHVFVSTVNRTLRSFLTAIVAAEHLLGVLPPGTHEYERLIRPSELARWGRRAGLELRGLSGLALDPFTGECALRRDPTVNYLAHFVARAPGAPGTAGAAA